VQQQVYIILPPPEKISWLQPCLGTIPLKFFVLQILFHAKKFCIKNMIKTEVLTPKVFCAPTPLALGYRSGLSERSKGKQTNCRVVSDELLT